MSANQPRHGVIEAPHYEEARERLSNDPIVKALAAELAEGIRAGVITSQAMFDDRGEPRFELMQRANAEYSSRGGTDHAHIGAVAEAIVRVWHRDGTQ